MGSLKSNLQKMGKIRKRKTKLVPVELDSKKLKQQENLDDYKFELSDLPQKENDGLWKDIILPDSVLQTQDLAGLGMFEEIDGSQYDIIKARADKKNPKNKSVEEKQEDAMVDDQVKEESPKSELTEEQQKLKAAKREAKK